MGMDSKLKTRASTAQWFEELDRLNSEPFLFERVQPNTKEREIFEDGCLDDKAIE
jgi:hypothetical protein